MLVAFLSRTPVIFHLHGAEFDTFFYEECGKFAQQYIRFVLKHCTYIIVLSGQWKKTLSRITENPEIMVEVSDKVMIAAGLKLDPNAPVEPAEDVDQFTEEHDQPISLD